MNAPDTAFIEDFLRGQRDCSQGVQHQAGQSQAYDRGYAAEYEQEQQLAWLSERMAK